jgi:hypothetical protein
VSGERNTLGVIAGGGSHYTECSLGIGQFAHSVVSAANLVCTRALQVLTLHRYGHTEDFPQVSRHLDWS